MSFLEEKLKELKELRAQSLKNLPVSCSATAYRDALCQSENLILDWLEELARRRRGEAAQRITPSIKWGPKC